MTDSAPTPDRILQFATGAWANGVLGAAAGLGVFDHLEHETDAAGLAGRAGLSVRGTQALLDGLHALGLVRQQSGRYRNAPDASAFLVKGRPGYLGAFADVLAKGMPQWASLADVVRSGAPAGGTVEVAENPFWEVLVPAIAGLSVPVAHQAARSLKLAEAGPVRWLDLGGGSGVFSAIWLGHNPKARGFQLDWANVNRVARDFVGGHGVGDRFETIDGDLHALDYGEAKYDYALLSHIAHQEAPEGNRAICRKVRRALKPGGTFVINDFILEDDRSGHPFAQLFHSNMLLNTRGGASWRRADYRDWLAGAGFGSVTFEPTGTPATLLFAR